MRNAKRRGFKVSKSSAGTTFISPRGPTMLISKHTSSEVETLKWIFRVEGNSSWSVGIIDDDKKDEDDELFQRGKIGLDSEGLCGGSMTTAKLHEKRIEFTYNASSGAANFKVAEKLFKQQGTKHHTVRLALSTFNGCKILMMSESSGSAVRVGCKVRVKPSVTAPAYGWGSVTHFDIGTVTAVASDGDVKIKFPKHSSWNGRSEEVEVVESAPRVKSAHCVDVGCRVRVKHSVSSPKYGWGAVSHSDIGTLTSTSGDGEIVVNFPKQSGWKGRLEDMEIIGPTPSAETVNVGDMVWVVSSDIVAQKACEGHGGWCEGMRRHLGKRLTVVKVLLDRVVLEGMGDSWMWGWGAVELSVSSGAKAELKVGDRVVLSKKYTDCDDADEGPLRPGDVGTIIEDDCSEKPFEVKIESGCTWWYTRAAVVAESSADAASSDGSDAGGLKVGDQVKLSKSYRRHSDAGRGPLRPGDLGTLTLVDSSSKPYLVQSPNGREWWYDRAAIVAADEDDESDGDDAEDSDGADEDKVRGKVPFDWGADHISDVAVSSGRGAERLTNGRCGDYWESRGEPGSHFILVTLRRPFFLHEVGVIVDPSSGESFCPERLRVLVGTDTSALQDLGVTTHKVSELRGASYLRLAAGCDRRVTKIRVQIEGSGNGSCGINCRVVGVCVRCGPGRRVGADKCVMGMKVVRGPDWMWGDQDGGAGRWGMVIELNGVDRGWATVQWEASPGMEYSYRIGADGCYDLAEEDNDSEGIDKVRPHGS